LFEDLLLWRGFALRQLAKIRCCKIRLAGLVSFRGAWVGGKPRQIWRNAASRRPSLCKHRDGRWIPDALDKRKNTEQSGYGSRRQEIMIGAEWRFIESWL